MVVRMWFGATSHEKRPLLVDAIVTDFDRLLAEGCLGFRVLTRSIAGYCEIIVSSEWESLEAIQSALGSDYDSPRYSENALNLIAYSATHVKHFEVAFNKRHRQAG